MDQTMRAAVFRGDGRLVLEERPVPVVEHDDDVVLEVGAVGICGTDLHILKVPPEHPARIGTIMGHEFAGTVYAIGGKVRAVRPGDHVIVDQNAPCGTCEMCRRGLPQNCLPLRDLPDFPGLANTYGIFRDGALAQYVRLKEFNLILADGTTPMWTLAMAEPIACALNGYRKAGLQPGESAVVLGAGPIGLLYISLMKAGGAGKILAVEPSPLRQHAAIACGATKIVDPSKEDIGKAVAGETNGRGADVVVEAVGPMIGTCVQVAGHGGRVIQFGHDESASVEVRPAEIVRKELSIHGAFLAKFTFEAARDLIEQGNLPLAEIVTHHLPLEEVHHGLDLLRKGKAIKVIIDPRDGIIGV